MTYFILGHTYLDCKFIKDVSLQLEQNLKK